jgi:hypothetical protein
MFEKFGVFLAGNENANFVIIDLVKFVKIEARDHAEFLVEIAFGLEIPAEAGADRMESAQPVDFLGLELVFSVDDADIDLEPIFVYEEFFDAVVQLQGWADEDEPVVGKANDLLEIVVRRACI